MSKGSYQHGECTRASRTPEYLAWQSLRSRCNTQKATGYHRYGARGIRVCDRWDIYENFLADMGRKPSPKHEIDRIDVNGNYEPSNCRWVTKSENMRNTRVTRHITHDGKTLSVAEWAEVTGISADTIRVRLYRGKPASVALLTPRR